MVMLPHSLQVDWSKGAWPRKPGRWKSLDLKTCVAADSSKRSTAALCPSDQHAIPRFLRVSYCCADGVEHELSQMEEKKIHTVGITWLGKNSGLLGCCCGGSWTWLYASVTLSWTSFCSVSWTLGTSLSVAFHLVQHVELTTLIGCSA